MWKLLAKIAELLVSILPKVFAKSGPKPPPSPPKRDPELDALIDYLEELIENEAVEVAVAPLNPTPLPLLLAESKEPTVLPKFLRVYSQVSLGPLAPGCLGVTARNPVDVTRVVFHCTQGPPEGLKRLWTTLRGGRRSSSGKPMYLGYHIVIAGSGLLTEFAHDPFSTCVQHATGWSATTVGVALMGTPSTITPEQKISAANLVRYLFLQMRNNGVADPSVVGHDEVDPYKRDDPGLEFMSHIRTTLGINLSSPDKERLEEDMAYTKKIKDAQRRR